MQQNSSYSYKYNYTPEMQSFRLGQQNNPAVGHLNEPMFIDFRDPFRTSTNTNNSPFLNFGMPNNLMNCNLNENQCSNANFNSENTNVENSESNKNNKVYINLQNFKPENVEISCDKNALLSVSATREISQQSHAIAHHTNYVRQIGSTINEDSKSNQMNGKRKMTILLEETIQLPSYVVDDNLIESISSNFHPNGYLTVEFPKEVKKIEETENKDSESNSVEKKNLNEPIQMKIKVVE